MLACTCTDIKVMTSMSPRFHIYLYPPNLTQIGWVIKILILLWTNGQKTEDMSMTCIRCVKRTQYSQLPILLMPNTPISSLFSGRSIGLHSVTKQPITPQTCYSKNLEYWGLGVMGNQQSHNTPLLLIPMNTKFQEYWCFQSFRR